MESLGERLDWIPRSAKREPTFDYRWVSNGNKLFELKSTSARLEAITGAITTAGYRARNHPTAPLDKDRFMIDVGAQDIHENLLDDLAKHYKNSPLKELWLMANGKLYEIPL